MRFIADRRFEMSSSTLSAVLPRSLSLDEPGSIDNKSTLDQWWAAIIENLSVKAMR
jgi:hypothetical protein